MSIRFRIDKNRGDVASLKKLINLEPASFKMKDMSEFVYDILHITTNLDIDDLEKLESDPWPEWLLGHVRDWNHIQQEVREINRSPSMSPLRSFRHIFNFPTGAD